MMLRPAIFVLFLLTAHARVHPRAERPFSTWMADSVIARGQGHGLSTSGTPQVSYEHGTFHSALRQLVNVTGNATYAQWIQSGIDNVLNSDGTVGATYNMSAFTLDDLRIGPSFIKLYQSTGNAKYKKASDEYRTQLNKHPRNTKGGFWHKLRYPDQMWLDGLYMGEPFYALYADTFESHNVTALTDLQNQFSLIWSHCRDTKTGLLRHGYFDLAAASRSPTPVWADPISGASPEVWIRAVGWYVVALADLLTPPDNFPTTHPAYAALLEQYRTLIPALAKNVDPATGAWWLVMSQPGRAGNYIESSGSAMFVYAMLKGVSSGLLKDPDGAIVKAASRAYEYLADTFVLKNADGTLNWNGTVIVGSLDQDGTFDYYIKQPINMNDLKGAAPFVLASIEYEKL
ncbi:glycosyl hydrolase [Exidia glandulosa HHB12029]|uniref:Glycosyl hydrolase n=1 Tax=Exidia glandulosa HHB12029 TaxID=1314781 RepID=A0A165PP73_EXIGL|nr:glycosyl hydrolase [Exidia glandulosa HHB12029]